MSVLRNRNGDQLIPERNLSIKPICRVCGSSTIREVGTVEYLAGYAWPVYDCKVCGCRFTRHDSTVYNLLHQTGAISYYRDYRNLAAQTKALFDKRDVAGLRRFLSGWSKYRFIINETADISATARLLEVGCSRGYLTSYFILSAQNILGIDVSAEAVNGACAAFGDHFVLSSSPAIKASAPYDIIYHVGMIGCVTDPVGFTKELLAMLKPGGQLLFNAPNRLACCMKNQLWLDSAPPPDLVTLYQPGFWQHQFAAMADVAEDIELCDADRSFLLGFRKLFGRAWRAPKPRALGETAPLAEPIQGKSDRVWMQLERGVGKLARVTGLSALAPRWPAEFGLFVSMRKKEVGPRC